MRRRTGRVTRSVYIIAEAGVNHNGSLSQALALADAAARAGADAVKFQTFRAERVASEQARCAAYQQKEDTAASQRDLLKTLELPPDAFRAIRDRCRRRRIDFLSTAFDAPSVELLAQLGQPCWKIPSGEITNLPYLRRIARFGRPVLLSTGMATLAEIKEALHVLHTGGVARADTTVLQCTTSYPAPPEEANLRAMHTFKTAFPGVAVGYSDHTRGPETALAAVALGATVIEKHFTLDRSLPGPDQAASCTPGELAELTRGIRVVETALGDGAKRPARAEQAQIPLVRRSIVAANPIRKGDVFTPENLTVKRPGTGVSPMRWDDVIGSAATADYLPDEMIDA